MLATLRHVFRELITWPVAAARTAIDLPRSMQRSISEANALMEVSREQLEVMRRQADQALEQAERMNELLSRVVKLTEPLERAQRGGEYLGEQLKKAIFGAQDAGQLTEEAARRTLEAAEDAEGAARGAEGMRGDDDDARARDSATRSGSEEPPVSSGEG